MAEGGETDFGENILEQEDEVCALQAIFEDTERFNVLRAPTPGKDDATPYQFQILVPVNIEDDGIEVKMWSPYEYDIQPAVQAASAIPSPTKPQFERTISGGRWHSSFRTRYLPPVTLEVTLPPSYPSQTSPMFSMSCPWLDVTQLSALCSVLDAKWKDNQGMPILYTWIDWLQSEALQFLGLEKCVMIVPFTEGEHQGSCDPRVIPECSDLRTSLLALLRYEYEQEMEEFSRNLHTCDICFEEKQGREFFRLNECLHHFCKDCLNAFCDVHVKDGQVQQLSCPSPKCETVLPPGIIQAVLGDEAYQRWERLLLQRTLDTMGDIVWCPRCNSPVIKEADETLMLANCTTCFFSFCTRCRDSWHQGNPCSGIEDKIRELEESSMKVQNSQTAAETLRKARLLKLELLSRDEAKKISKPCPNPSCGVDLMKFDGCNKVTCSMCHGYMCWLCGKAIKGYEHFTETGGCNGMLFNINRDNLFVFGGHLRNRVRPEGRVHLDAALQADPQARERIITCPSCGQRNLKENQNNHIRCWCCKTNFCFMCKQVIKGIVSSHFMATRPCQQHSR